MAVERLTLGDPAAVAAAVRALAPGRASVEQATRAIVDDVRSRGDAALHEYAERFDGVAGPLVVTAQARAAALAALDPSARDALELAIANVDAVARAGVGDDAEVVLAQGHTVTLREGPVRRAGICAPGGQAPYPSTVVMGVVTARAAGVDEIVVCSPAAHPAVVAACELCGADVVIAAGGAHAVAALAYGTETLERVDVIAGPGGLYVQEAKRQVSGDVGVDGFFGPSDLLVLATTGADPRALALDLAAQAEHGEGTIVCAVSDDPALLDALAFDPGEAVGALVDAPDPAAALAFAEAFAPEHLQLVGADAEAAAPSVRNAGCVFVGPASATAFGDYVAGSNHSLPTEGTARFASGMSAATFRRRHAEVRIGGAAGRLAGPGAVIARVEGFERHAASMEVRENGDDHAQR